MDTINTIKARRSVRKFNNKEAKKELIEIILESATQAPFALSLGSELTKL